MMNNGKNVYLGKKYGPDLQALKKDGRLFATYSFNISFCRKDISWQYVLLSQWSKSACVYVENPFY